MSRSRAVRSGFSALFAQPAIYFGEAMWRGVFALTAWSLAGFAVVNFLKSLPVNNLDAFGLSGIFPPMFAIAVRHVFAGTGPLFFRTVALLILSIAAVWWIASTFGQFAVLPALLNGKARLRVLLGLQFLRTAISATAAIALAGIAMLTLRIGELAGRRAYLVALVVAIGILLLNFAFNWYLIIAPILAVRAGTGVFASFDAALRIPACAARQFTWIAFVFGCLRVLLIAFALSVFFSLAAVVSQFASGGIIAAVILTAFFYVMFSFLLHAARLASYVRVIDWRHQTSGN